MIQDEVVVAFWLSQYRLSRDKMPILIFIN